ncbi:MAG TPA: TlpA disulfide reductase family protein [Verrucomicrobiae bacterium]|nr:TlpA disulfide reductase family protein [Verrucomicrobiae bacterium]
MSSLGLSCTFVLLTAIAAERVLGEKPQSPAMAWAGLDYKESDEARAIVGHRLAGEERAQWRDKLLANRLAAADRAAEFRRRFPDDTNAPAALRLEAERLILAGDVAMAQDTNVIERLRRTANELVRDTALSERTRSQLASALLNRVAYARYNSEKPDLNVLHDEELSGARFMIKSFPKRAEFWEQLAMQAGTLDRDASRPVVEEILKGAPPGAGLEIAKGLKWKLEAVGQPFSWAFTALDGTRVDTAAWKGKVVLIDFWATWCPPCVAALPDVRKQYEKHHPRDLEIIGVSLDSDSAALKRFLAKHKDPWPQHFDGQSWKSPAAYQHGVQMIPSLWLLDRKGILRTMDAHHDLEAQLAALIAER